MKPVRRNTRPTAVPFESATSLLGVFRALFRHKGKATLFFVGTSLVTLTGATFMPRPYVSEAQLFFTLGPEAGLDPSSSPQRGGINFDDPRQGMILSALDILRSRELRERVVSELGPSTVLGQTAAADDRSATPSAVAAIKRKLAALKRQVAAVLRSEELPDDEKAVRKLAQSIRIACERNSNVVSISCEAGTPELARRICRTLVDKYRAHHVAIHASEESVVELQRSLDETDAQLVQARQSLQALIAKVGPEPETQYVVAQGRVRQRHAEVTDILARNNLLRQQGRWPGAAYSGSVPADLDDTNDSRRLAEFVIAPELRREFDQARSELFESLKVHRFFREHEAAVSSLNDRVARLGDQAQSLEQRLSEARIQANLSDELISSVKIAQQPTLSRTPTGPRLSLILVLGAMLSVVGSLGLVFLCEAFDGTLRATEDVERMLRVPVLVSIPRKNVRAFTLN